MKLSNVNRQHAKTKICFGNEVVSQTTSYFCLRTMITSNGAFNLAMKVLYKRAVKAISALLSSMNKSKETSPKILQDFFDKMMVQL